MLYSERTLAFVAKRVTLNLNVHIVLHIDAVAALGRYGVTALLAVVGQPCAHTRLIDQCEVLSVVGHDVAILPLELVQHADYVAVFLVIYVQRNPVPAGLQVQFLIVNGAACHHYGGIDCADYRAVVERDCAVWLQYHNLSGLMMPQFEGQFDIT